MDEQAEGTFGEFRFEMIHQSRFGAPSRSDLARFSEMLDLPQTLRPQASFDPPERCDVIRRFHGTGDANQAILPHFVECIGADQTQRHIAAWIALAARALESNVFLDPAFALAAARHLSGRRRPNFLLVWEQDETTPRKRLIALWPILRPRLWFGATFKTWVHDYCCSGTPLLDRTEALASLDAIADYLRRLKSPAPIVSAAQLRKNGPTIALLRRFATLNGLAFTIVASYDRAALDVTQIGLGASEFVSSRKRKELRRQLRRLHEKGPVSIGVAREGAELIRQVEAFLILEAKGWKGREGGAFLKQSEHAAFVRAMVEAMGQENRCRIYWMAISEKVIASNIVLCGDGSAYFWKTAYDEDFAFASPGVMLTMNMTDALLRDPRILSVDSCAISAHPMIDHVWRDRIPMADVMLSLRAGKVRAFEFAAQYERCRRRLRENAKSAWDRFRAA